MRLNGGWLIKKSRTVALCVLWLTLAICAETWGSLVADSLGIVVIVCKKYSGCDTVRCTVLSQSENRYALTGSDGVLFIERANLNTLEWHHDQGKNGSPDDR